VQRREGELFKLHQPHDFHLPPSARANKATIIWIRSKHNRICSTGAKRALQAVKQQREAVSSTWDQIPASSTGRSQRMALHAHFSLGFTRSLYTATANTT